ncbi:MAG: inorganic diphosphatase [Mycoplasmataceae bacterium]|nr:inorganic diphosphatase [Mycoplasmataceae bacterium]
MNKEIIIEIGKDTNIKYEYNPYKKVIEVDRVLFGTERYPQNYGFIQNKLDWDGDPLDSLIISNHSFMTGSHLEARIIGSMEMIDGGETDTKLISVFNGDPRLDYIKTIKDVPQHLLDEIANFFKNYKNLQKKEVIVKGFLGKKEAESVIKECEDLYTKYFDKMSKEEFLKNMKKEHPEKYL